MMIKLNMTEASNTSIIIRKINAQTLPRNCTEQTLDVAEGDRRREVDAMTDVSVMIAALDERMLRTT